MSAITTHVLDTSRGRPAAGMSVMLERRESGGQWTAVGHAKTDADGRAQSLMPAGAPPPGSYRLTFDTQRYFEGQSIASLYPSVVVIFDVRAGESHYHIPLLLSPYGYSTYRGT